MVSNASSLQALSYMNMPRVSAGGRASVPVPPSQVIYAHFRYVKGFPSDSGEGGVSIDKLRILNSIIDQLVSMKTTEAQKAKVSQTAAAELNTKLNTEELDHLIEYYQNEIKNSMAQKEALGYGGTPASPAVLTLTA